MTTCRFQGILANSPARRGNVVLVAVMVMGLAAAVVIAATDRTVDGLRLNKRSERESEVLAALDVVLSRRQQAVIDLATNGQPEDFIRWDQGLGRDGSPVDADGNPVGSNYGADFVGQVEVRWKVEPCWAKRLVSAGSDPDDPADDTYELVENPPPSDGQGAPDVARENRGAFYVYRISAEARFDPRVVHNALSDTVVITDGQQTEAWQRQADGSSVAIDPATAPADASRVDLSSGASNESPVRAQGVRFVVTPNESALNYLLYYAQRGPKADIELSHGPALTLVGDIYSGGSIYVGSGTAANDWSALRPVNGPTRIGVPPTVSAWAAGTTYGVGALVAKSGSHFQCTAAHTSSGALEPLGTGSAWKAYWHDVTVSKTIALDGAYRLSKQLLFGSINGLPLTGTAPGGYSLAASYWLTMPPTSTKTTFPCEQPGDPKTVSFRMPDPAYCPPNPIDVYRATHLGTIINPARATDVLASSGAAPDDQRVFMGVPLRGLPGGGMPGNDSRDRARTDFVWATDSVAPAAPGFDKAIRTLENGAAPETMASTFLGRPDEPQKLTYYELDGDPTTDEHEYAMPVFLASEDRDEDGTLDPGEDLNSNGVLDPGEDANGNGALDAPEDANSNGIRDLVRGRSTTAFKARGQVDRNGDGTISDISTTSYSNPDLDCIEVPGTYLGKALGSGLHMARRSDYRGWIVTDSAGADPSGLPGNGVGLVIRERPLPDQTYFTPTSTPAPGDPLYMPFAYGHIQQSIWPFVSANVNALSSQGYSGSPYYTQAWWSLRRDLTRSYQRGGIIRFSAQNLPGPNHQMASSGGPDMPNPPWDGYTTTDGWNDTASAYKRFPAYYQDSWRLIALSRPRDSGATGVIGTYYNDRPNAATQWLGPFGGRPAVTRTDAAINFSWGAGGPVTGTNPPVGADYFSVRWQGYVTPPGTEAETFTFYAVRSSASGGVRVWVGDRETPVIDDWNPGNSGDVSGSTFTPLRGGEAYLVTVEYAEATGSAGLRLDWSSPSMTRTVVPFTATADPAYRFSRFTAVQARLDRITGPADTQKVGLMLRPGSGLSPMQDGRDPYLVLGYSPRRGIFAQIRGERSLSQQASSSINFVGTAKLENDGDAPFDDSTDNNGEISVGATGTYAAGPPLVTGVKRVGRLTPTYRADGMTHSVVNGSQRWVWSYMPGDGGHDAGASPVAAWLPNSGMNARPQNGLVPLNNPFPAGAVPEGTVDRVFRGSLVLRAQKWPQEQSTRRLDATWDFRLDNLAVPATQRFRWSPGLAYPAGWPAWSTAIDDRNNRTLQLFADVTGAATVNGGTLFTINTGNPNSSMDSTGATAGARLFNTWGGGTSSSGWTWWFRDVDANGQPDAADLPAFDPGPQTYGDPKAVWYINSGGVDTRPRIYNGPTLVGYLSQADTLRLMDENYGAGHYALTTLPAYTLPTAGAAHFRPGDPTVAAAAPPGSYPGWTRVTGWAAATPNRLTVGSARPFAVGDILALQQGTATEYVRVSTVVSTTQIDVVRGTALAPLYGGSAPLANPAAPNALLCAVPTPVSMVTQAITETNPTGTYTVASTTGLLLGDTLLVGGAGEAREIWRITAIPTLTSLTVTRDPVRRSTHAINRPILTGPVDVGRLVAALANTPATGTVSFTVSPAARVATLESLLARDPEQPPVIRINDEHFTVTAANSVTGLVTATRAADFTTAAGHAANDVVVLMAPKTFAIPRSRTVTLDLNPWISAGCAPLSEDLDRNGVLSAGEDVNPGDKGVAASTDDFIDNAGWFWANVNAWAPWRYFFNGISPVRTTGGIPPRAWERDRTAPRTATPGANNVIQGATSTDTSQCDAVTPSLSLLDDNFGGTIRWADDQPAAWTNGRGYAAGDLVWYKDALYRCQQANAAAAVNAPDAVPLGSIHWSRDTANGRIWLRIERVGTTSRVRLLYGISADSDAPTTWKPVLAANDTTGGTDYDNLPAGDRPGLAGVGHARELELDLAPWFRAGGTTLSTALTATASAAVNITVADSGPFAKGDVLCIDDEQMRVVDIPGGTLLRVERPYNGTTVAAHSVGANVVQQRWRGDDLIVGLCGQSGSITQTVDATFSSAQVETLDGTVDKDDWETAAGTDSTQDIRYLCSQYQVFFGPYDITEDFFSWNDGANAREDWIYNQREFWSQSRWWLDGAEKDPTLPYPSDPAIPTNRETWAKTTLLNLDMRSVQDYLKQRTVAEAVADVFPAAGLPAPIGAPADTLASRVPTSGLILHVSRYNRFPYNPNCNGENPWNPWLPSIPTSPTTNEQLAALTDGGATFRTLRGEDANRNGVLDSGEDANGDGDIDQVHLLKYTGSDLKDAIAPVKSALLLNYLVTANAPPPALSRTPPFRPQDYHHGVMLSNASSIDWGLTGAGDKFGASKLLLVTPNALYFAGDFNTVAHPVDHQGTTVSKMTPAAVFCDSANFLSNAFDPFLFQRPGITVTGSAVFSGGTLAHNQIGGVVSPAATSTSYALALLTHNQPTTKHSVRLGEASSVINLFQFCEDWTGQDFTLIGSVVIMDTRRHTQGYLLDATKGYGQSPFGWMGNDTWAAIYGVTAPGTFATNVNSKRWAASAGASGAIYSIYGAPNRKFFYNPDFKLKEGTPPEMPFGVKTVGVGGWVKTIR